MKRKRILNISLFLALLALHISAHAQSNQAKKPNAPTIHAVGRAQHKSILLRWVVTNPVAWQYANEYGYVVERYTVLRNGHMYAGKERVVLAQGSTRQRINGDFGTDTIQKSLLTPVPLKPRPAEEWKTLALQDDNAAVLAQALFGGLPVAKDEQKNISTVLGKNEELKQRFAFGMIAADRSFPAAQMAGLGLIDSTAKPNEKYLYRIYTAVPGDKLKTDTASIFIGLQDQQPLPVPKDLFIDINDKVVTLSWNFNLLKQVYNAYYIERSEDGKTFARISGLPVVNLTQNRNKNAPAFYTDTLAQYDKSYYYRIVGMSSFGEEGPPSETVKAIGRRSLIAVPNITTASVLSEKEVEIEWEFEESATTSIDHFVLNRATNVKGPFTAVNSWIPVEKRKTRFSKLSATNYFTITAVGKNGRHLNSFPYLVQPVDSIPPAPPTGLTGVIDTTGKIILKWKANIEPDLMGYQLLKRNLDGEALMVLTKKPFARTIFTERVDMNSLNDEVQYAVVALDKRGNQSQPSPIIKVQKPDKIAPVAPVFSNYKIEKEKLILQWVPSSSRDAVLHKIYRKEIQNKTNGDWILVKETDERGLTSCADNVVPGKTYAYLAIAIDKNNNESPGSNVLTLTVPPLPVRPPVKQIQAAADRQEKEITLEWKYTGNDILEQEIYKAAGEAPITLWKVVAADQRSIIDKDIVPGNVYKYAVRVIFKDGGVSSWKEVSVQY